MSPALADPAFILYSRAFEEVDPGSGEMIGNFPQAFSHIGLVNAAWAIAQAEQSAASPAPAGLGQAEG